MIHTRIMYFKKATKVWSFLIIWFSIKYYIMTFYYGFPSCKEYDCLINDLALRDRGILYRIPYSIIMSLMHGIMESAVWFMIPYLKVYYIIEILTLV